MNFPSPGFVLFLQVAIEDGDSVQRRAVGEF